MSASQSNDATIEAPIQEAVPAPIKTVSKQEDEITRSEPIELGVLSKTQDALIEDQPVTFAVEEPPNRRHMSGWRLYVLTFGYFNLPAAAELNLM
jgi:hypothetical protein